MSWTKKELEAYDARGMYIQDERGRVAVALEEGEKIGIEKGKSEEKRNLAGAMLKEGIKPETISRITGLTVDEILRDS